MQTEPHMRPGLSAVICYVLSGLIVAAFMFCFCRQYLFDTSHVCPACRNVVGRHSAPVCFCCCKRKVTDPPEDIVVVDCEVAAPQQATE